MSDPDSNVASNVLSTIGTVMWCIQLSPQVYTNWKTKNTEGFPPIFMFLWCLSSIPFAIYFMMSNSYIPLQIQPHLFMTLCYVAWVQSMYYPPNPYPKKKIMLLSGSFLLVAVACELGFILWLKPVYAHGTTWPALIFGILASIILALGLVPPYFELFKRKGRVVGINFIFLAMDSSGAVFSMASMCIGVVDPMGMTLYAIVIAMELGIFTSHAIWYLRFRYKKDPIDDEEQAQITDDEGEQSAMEDSTVENDNRSSSIHNSITKTASIVCSVNADDKDENKP